MRAWFKRLVCAFIGHDKQYIEFGASRIPYGCRRCGSMWNEW
jgi:hypothetical protein